LNQINGVAGMSKGEITTMKKLSLITVGFMLILFVTGAHAAYLVDTGDDPSNVSQTLSFFSDSSGQWLAGEFVLDSSSTITDIEGFMQGRAGTVTIAIYNDGGEFPGSNQMFSQSFEPGGGSIFHDKRWLGISSLSWDLGPGTYWVSFEVRDGSSYAGSMGKATENPLLHNAYKNPDGWVPYDLTNTPVKIQGDVSSVPIPGAIWLLGSGLIGLVGLKKKFKK